MNLPEAFVRNTRKLLGDEYAELEQALGLTPPVSIRVNDKMNYVPSDDKVAWCNSGYYLAERPLFTADPLFHAGAYYVQEASSMFLKQVVNQHFAEACKVLDLCAAPGGKSTLLSQALPPASLLVSNEIIRSRAYILAENLIKWGNPNVVVSNNDPRSFAGLPGFFDAIVVDAPCSGEGMFRKDAGAIEEWSEGNVNLCVSRQREILGTVWDTLKTDGILIYSTCTFNRQENEENVSWICSELGAELLRMDLPDDTDISATDFGYRFYPHKTKGEGFFISVMRKTGQQNQTFRNRNSDRKRSIQQQKSPSFPFKLKDPERWEIVTENNKIKAYDKRLLNDFNFLNSQLKLIHSGLELGEYKGSDFIPSPVLALSKALDLNSVELVNVDYETAIHYLRRDAILLSDFPKGYLLVCYKGLGLGWVKNLGNRCNNLYPQEWRIRMNL